MKSTEGHKEISWLGLARSVWYFLKGKRWPFVFWTAALFIVFFYQLIPALIIGRIIDFFTTFQRGQPLTDFYSYVLLLGVLNAGSSLIRLTAKNRLAQLDSELTYNVKVMGFERLVDYSLTWHNRENAGNKIQRIQNGITAFHDLRHIMAQDGFQTIALFIGVLVIFAFLHPAFILFFVFYLLFFFGINALFYKRTLALSREFNRSRENSSGSFYEGLSNVLTIKTLGVKDSFKQNIYESEQKTKDLTYKLVALGINKWKIFQLTNAVAISVYLLMIGNGLVTGVLTIGSVFVFYNYLTKLLDAAASSTEIFERLIEIKASIARLMPIFWQTEASVFGSANFPENWSKIKIENGEFNYRGQVEKENTLFEIKGLNLTINRGENLGIAGSSGSGKSTFGKLLLGLYQLKAGTFTVDSTDYYSISHQEITRSMAIVLQETEMFNLSMLENITLMRQVKPELLEKAIRLSQLDRVIAALPQGLATPIGERGYQLSGGERQRVGIARAICKDPEIIVLDETTSSLDTQTESQIHQAIEAELKEKTLIVIAHRVSTLKNMDKICVFREGKIVEEGSYESLLSNPNSHFAKVSQTASKLSQKD